MSKIRSASYDTMRGGQIVFHYIRLAYQVITKNILGFAVVCMLLSLMVAKMVVSDSDFYYGFKWARADIMTQYLWGADGTTSLELPDGRVITVTWSAIRENQTMRDRYNSLKGDIIWCVFSTLLGCILLLFCWFYYLRRVGKRETQDNHIRGGQLGDKKEYLKVLKEKQRISKERSRFKIAGLPIPPKSDRSHFAFIGAPGSGKSVLMTQIMEQHRRLGDKNFILDVGGHYTKKFYREGYDVILSPADKRSRSWDLWSEGLTRRSYSLSAKALIPEKGSGSEGSDFFSQAARLVLRAATEVIANRAKANFEKPDNKKLTAYLMKMEDSALIDLIKNSTAKSILNEDSERTTHSIRATLTAYSELLSELPTDSEYFSFNEWLNSDDDRWVFVPMTATDREYFKPVITTWIEHYVVGVLSLAANNLSAQRKNWFCDELYGYGKVPSLPTFLAESRKYMGCAYVGLQNRNQLEAIYGRVTAGVMEDTIRSYLVFAASGTSGADWSSKILSSSEIHQVNENLTMGASDVRDSVGISSSTKDHRLVTASEILNMDDLDLYCRFGRGFPVIFSSIRFKELPDIAEGIDGYSDAQLEAQSFLEHHEATKGGKDKVSTEVARGEISEGKEPGGRGQDFGVMTTPDEYESYAAKQDDIASDNPHPVGGSESNNNPPEDRPSFVRKF